jgi:hypothetical protein
MKHPQDMTDEEILLERARIWAARRYREEGHVDFAERVERGERDDCQEMRVVQFFVQPPQPHDPEFVRAWEAISTS